MTWDAPAVVLVIGAIGLLIVNTINAWKSNTKADVANKKADALLDKTAKIDATTNGHYSELTKQLSVAVERIYGLNQIIEAMTNEKREAAHVAAVTAAIASPSPGQVSVIADRLKAHDNWERDKDAAVQVALEQGKAAGIEQERARGDSDQPIK